MPARVVVVGLGPAGSPMLTPAARDVLTRHGRRYARTRRHPAIQELEAEGISFESFDALYERADDLDAVYREIVEALVAAAQDGDVVYAVPGNPTVAERTVELLRETGVPIEVVPGLSFADLAWSRLGIDPMKTGARVVDARALDAGTSPMLIAQCDTKLLLSDVKLKLLEALPPATDVVVLHHLGLPDEKVTEIELAELDHDVEPDHLTSIWVATAPTSGMQELARLLALAVRLRRPGGCPWDAEQSHHSLTRYLLEESYEVVEAVEQLPADAPEQTSPDDPAYAQLQDELGDLLYQVIFHAVLAEEAGAFGMAEIARGIHDKLVHRHPHVFGDVDVQTSNEVMSNWEQIKKKEKGSESIVAGITPGLPSLLYAHKLLRKAASVGLDPGDVEDSLTRIEASTAALRATGENREEVLGELLAAAVALARAMGVDTESALRGWAARFRSRFENMERLAAERGVELADLPPEEVDGIWGETSVQT